MAQGGEAAVYKWTGRNFWGVYPFCKKNFKYPPKHEKTISAVEKKLPTHLIVNSLDFNDNFSSGFLALFAKSLNGTYFLKLSLF